MIHYPEGYTFHFAQLAEALNLKSDSFTITKVIDGGMGTCYKICDYNNTPYALKLIHSDLLSGEDSDESIQRYISEIKSWLTFSSCNGVAEAVSVVRLNDMPCVVSKWMDGGDMNNIIHNFDKELFYTTMDRIVTTLKWVYDNYSVIHRDLKPGNILLDKDNRAYVADWGLAKIIYKGNNAGEYGTDVKSGINPAITQVGIGMGTAAYAAPEQMLGLPNIDFRADIYSLGCIMYQWETGHFPYELKGNWFDIAKAKATTRARKIGGVFHSTHLKASKIIMKCLEIKPDNRYQSYDDLLEDLNIAASKNVVNFIPFVIKQRYMPVTIGYNEFEKRLKSHDLGIVGKKGFGIVSQEDLSPYLDEALSLSAIGDYKKSNDVYKKLIIPDVIRKFPNFGYHQFIVCNYAYNLSELKDYTHAIEVLQLISSAKNLPVEYYLNLSKAYVDTLRFKDAIEICSKGLSLYPDDMDLQGNYTIALAQTDHLEEAKASADKRLKNEVNVHSLSEAAFVYFNCAERDKNVNFTSAIESYKLSLSLYRKALDLNPRYAVALYNVSLLLFKMRRYTDSFNWGVHISKIEKGTSELNAINAAKNMLWTSSFEAGLKFCDNWLKKYPNSIGLQRVRAEILVDGYVIGNYSSNGMPIVERSSLEFFTNIINDVKNRKASDIIYLAKLHLWMGDEEDVKYSFDLLRWGKKIFPNNWKFSFYLSSFSKMRKDFGNAIEEAKESNRLAPCRETTYSLLASALELGGYKEEASKQRAEYNRVKDLKEKLYDSCKGL